MHNFPAHTQFQVNTFDGSFNFHTQDLAIPAPGIPLRIERYHNSLASYSINGGWRFNFDENISYEPLDSSITVNFPDGIKERFIKQPDNSYLSAVPGSTNIFFDNKDGSFTLRFKNKIRHLFYTPDSKDDYCGRLYKIIDNHNNTLTYYWQKFGTQVKIVRIKDTVGRILNITYETTAEGYDLMTIADWTGRKLTYTFISGWLTYFKDCDGNITTYKPGSSPAGGGSGGEYYLVGIYELITPNGLWVKNYGGDRPDGVRVFKQVYGDGGMVEYQYDFDNYKTTVIEGERVTLYEYNEAGDLLQVTDPLGNITFYDYDTIHRVTKITDPKGGETSFTYDGNNNLLTHTDALGHTTTYEYDSKWNKVSKITSPEPFEFETTFAYDEATGDLLSITDPLENTTTLEYYPNGLIKNLTDARAKVTHFDYDNFGNLIKLTDAKSQETNFKYDQAGNLIAITDAKGKISKLDYSLNNQLQSVINALGNASYFRYDKNLNLKTALDPLNNSVQYGYQALNELYYSKDALGKITAHIYDTYGNVTQIQNAEFMSRFLSYDVLDRLVSEEDALGRITQFQYDPYCNKHVKIAAEGKKTTYYKDILCRLTKIEFHDNSYYQFGYDNLGQRISMTQPQARKYGEFKYGELKYGYDPDNNTTYEYDDNSRLTKIHYPNDKTIGMAYDEVGNITSIYDIDEVETAYEYDDLNRLTKVTYNETETTYEYDAVSNLIKMTLPNGITADYEYDDAYRLTRILWKNGEVTLYDIKYELDAAGNRTRKIIAKPLVPDKVYDYIYDAVYRLAQSNEDGEAKACYRYDGVGNRLELAQPDDKVIYRYNAADELTSVNEIIYQHDKDGNLISIKDPAEDKALRYQYDYAGRLWKVLFPDDDTEEYIYNGDGLRIKRKAKSGNVTNFYWVPLGMPQVLNETDDNDDTTAGYILGRGLIGIKTTSNNKYYLTDGLGSVIALTDADGDIIDTYEYDDFGNLTAQTGTSYNPYRYTGQQFDAETGLYYLRARYYDPRLGRFISRDLYKGSLYNPLSLNLYVYCMNNPIIYVDPSGKGIPLALLGRFGLFGLILLALLMIYYYYHEARHAPGIPEIIGILMIVFGIFFTAPPLDIWLIILGIATVVISVITDSCEYPKKVLHLKEDYEKNNNKKELDEELRRQFNNIIHYYCLVPNSNCQSININVNVYNIGDTF